MPAKPSRRTTFWTTLLFHDEMESILSSEGPAKSPCPSQASFIEPETLSYQITLFGPKGADVRHPLTSKIYLKSCK